MIPLPGLSIKTKELSASAAYDGKVVRMKLTGSAESAVAKELDTFCKNVHAAVLRYNTTATVDLTELEFMNSSCLKCFVTWLDRLSTAPTNEQYTIRFATNPKKHWQARSLNALVAFARDLVAIEAQPV